MALKVKFCDIDLKNPLIAGSCDYSRSAEEFSKIARSGVSSIVLKSVSDVKNFQNPYITKINCLDTYGKPWIKGRDFGALYSRGGAMLTINEWLNKIDEILKASEKYEVIPIGSICASKIETWVEYSKIMESKGLRIIELNLGNPHFLSIDNPKTDREISFLDSIEQIIRSVTTAVTVPVVAKLSPQSGNLVDIVKVVEKSGAAGVTISHRFQGLLIDLKKREPLSSSLFGYGGPWMTPITVGNVFRVSKTTDLHICASGGISKVDDVLQMLLAGASTVQFTTIMLIEGARVVNEILAGLETYLKQHEVVDVQGLVGCAKQKTGAYDHVEKGEIPEVKDTSKCPTCRSKPCLESCLFQAISIGRDGIPEISDRCIACEFCLHMCPFPGVLSTAGCRYFNV